MVSSANRLWLAFAVVAALCLAAPLSASAATTRYASPTGGTAPCIETSPCSIENALSNAEGLANGDTVLLAPGTYHPLAELAVFRNGVTVAGEPGKAPPLIEAVGERGLFLPNPGTVRDLRIHSSAATFYGLAVTVSGSAVERIESTGEAARACAFGAVTVRDSLCASSAGVGIEAFNSTPTPSLQETNLFNVTAIASGEAIGVAANEHASVTVNAVNTIASGGTIDVAARSFLPTAPAHVNLSHSNFDEVETEGTEAQITPSTEAGNQSAAPVFVDEAGGDYREQASSPTRLAGDLGVVLPGELDLAGNPRTTNCAGTVGVDIGAYQFECPAPQVGDSTVTVIKPPVQEPAPATKPSLSKLRLNPPKFTVTGKGKKGTTISFTLSTAASVKLEVLGKRKVKGKKPKTVTLGSLPSISGKAGANSVKFSGKLKGKPLDPGKYTLRATATAGALSSSPASAGFEVRIP
jgi:hypothetical protein